MSAPTLPTESRTADPEDPNTGATGEQNAGAPEAGAAAVPEEAPASETAPGPEAALGTAPLSDPAAASTAASAAESSAVVPVSPVRHESQKTSFWQRIRLGRGRSVLDRATGDDRLIARLDSIASRIETSEEQIGDRLRQLDDHISEVWQVEEQLSRLMELRDMLTDLQERQGRIDGRLRGLARRLSLLTFLAGTAAVAGLAAIVLALR